MALTSTAMLSMEQLSIRARASYGLCRACCWSMAASYLDSKSRSLQQVAAEQGGHGAALPSKLVLNIKKLMDCRQNRLWLQGRP